MGYFILYQFVIILSRFMRLKELRKKKNLTQLQLALALNMNQNSISRYETGAHEADYATLALFADFFHVSIDYLLERTDDPTPPK